MKALLTLLVALSYVTFTASAQALNYGNFRVEEQLLIYQKVFNQDSVTVERLATYFGKQSFAAELKAGQESLEFSIKDLVVDYRKFGFSQVSTPPVIQTGRFSGRVTISVKEGKYRM